VRGYLFRRRKGSEVTCARMRRVRSLPCIPDRRRKEEPMLKLRTRTEATFVKVAIVERYALVRAAIRDLLAGETDIAITAAEPNVPILLQVIRHDPASS